MPSYKAQALIVVLVGGSLAAIVLNNDWWWPFSAYPMYAAASASPVLDSYRLEGITPAGERVSLLGTRAIEPFDPARMISSLRRLSHSPVRLEIALADCLDRYERRRRKGELAGPSLAGLRLYRAWWRLDVAKLAPETAPDREVLVAQVGALPFPR